MRDKYLVVTGGAGFIGSHLTHALANGNDAVVIDDLSTGKKENLRFANPDEVDVVFDAFNVEVSI